MVRNVCYLILPFLSLTCLAQDVKLDVRYTKMDGKEYVCFGADASESLLLMRENYPKLELKLEVATERMSVLEEMVNVALSANENSRDQISLLTDENINLKTQIQDQDSFFNNKYFWFVVGIVLGGGSAALIVWIARGN